MAWFSRLTAGIGSRPDASALGLNWGAMPRSVASSTARWVLACDRERICWPR